MKLTQTIFLTTLAITFGAILNSNTIAQTSKTATQEIVESAPDMTSVRYGFETVDGLKIFFREAGDPSKPTIVLLHGFQHRLICTTN